MRRTRHRRRFHTDRVVRNRRARWYREAWWPEHNPKRLAYGALADRSWDKLVEPRRAREKRAWRRDWGV